jgi:uncharacterized repeat protein (TIGR03803 family)
LSQKLNGTRPGTTPIYYEPLTSTHCSHHRACGKPTGIAGALIASLGLIQAGRVTAQTFSTLHSFTAVTGLEQWTNSDGSFPVAGLILSSNTLYGTASWGGSAGCGTVFKVSTGGTGFTNLH